MLEQLAVFDEDDRLAADKMAEFDAVIAEYGEQDFQTEHDENRDQAGEEGDAAVLHGDGGEIGHQHGDDEFRRLHFSKLALTHEADGGDQKQI